MSTVTCNIHPDSNGVIPARIDDLTEIAECELHMLVLGDRNTVTVFYTSLDGLMGLADTITEYCVGKSLDTVAVVEEVAL